MRSPSASSSRSSREALRLRRRSWSESTVVSPSAYPHRPRPPGGRVPVVIAPSRLQQGDDKRSMTPQPPLATAGGAAAPSASCRSTQRREGALWGLACDGLTLRIVRDNASLTRPRGSRPTSQRIFTEERYADFAALWLLLHESRFGRATSPTPPSARWRPGASRRARRGPGARVTFAAASRTRSSRSARASSPTRTTRRCAGALQTARSRPGNGVLQPAPAARLPADLPAHRRGARDSCIPRAPPTEPKPCTPRATACDACASARSKRSAHDRHADLWEATKIVFRGVDRASRASACPRWAASSRPRSAPRSMPRRSRTARCCWRCSSCRGCASRALSRVNWRDMGPRSWAASTRACWSWSRRSRKTADVRFATGDETKATPARPRAATTPPTAGAGAPRQRARAGVGDTIARNPSAPSRRCSSSAVVDPACGSGHFLLAAARRLAAHVARAAIANGTPSAAEYRHALRKVVGRCIYGVDLNPMAVELCKVALWMEAVEPGLPLTFLDSHIQHGNALLGRRRPS
jgi:hypothetical protein